MMKLLVFSPYYPPHMGGLESHADEFNRHLSQRGMDITVFTPRLPISVPEKETRHRDVKILRFPAFEIIPNYPFPKFWSLRFWKLFRNLFEENFDIVISRTRFFSTSLLALAYAKIKKIRWVHIEHGSDFVQLSSKIKTHIAKIYDLSFGKLIFRSSDLNISISQAVREFVERFDKRESPIIYRGIDIKGIEKIAPDMDFKNKYKDKVIIAWAGRLYKWKGVKNTIKAIKQLPAEIKKNIVFVIMGDGEDKDDLQKISDNSVIFLGSIPREKVLGILKVSDIYIHSSDPGGGLSTSLLEAMCCGCGIIATKNEGAEEIITNNENGLLIEESDPDIIAAKITELLRNAEKIKALSKNAGENTQKLFLWEQTISKYLDHFK
ncbi:MAG TPA: glycosyltransferase family 4 protein [Candidatus Moranbacteria bacterium]|nr:glycosyltransferase family 4 protein [Candidatus Moranbacteria bacterium]HQB60000.1 glycosyltransferase family 4 protein [Candidatus Moranbacteria bacterium]